MTSAVTHQDLLRSCVSQLFVGENIVTNVRREAEIVNPSTGLFLELDIWIPSLKICFEFQDLHHYDTTWYSQVPLASIRFHDQFKNEHVQKRADTLVVVPFWWDGTSQSLASTINFHRPDLLADCSLAPHVPLNPTKQHLKYGSIPNVGQLMLASFPTSPYFHSSISSENSWWLGEKYDGLRFVWNPMAKCAYGRSGVALHLPQHRISVTNFLDGEIWFGRGGFENAQKILFGDGEVNWSFLRIAVFDDPSPRTNLTPFEKRYANVLYSFAHDHPFLVIASRYLCFEPVQIVHAERNILGDGGEGIMLRLPCSEYYHGRSTSLLKWKSALGDKEALVISTGQTYNLLLPDGIGFEIQSKDIKHGLKVVNGDIVTFSYNVFSRRSVPVDPFVYRVRHDLIWEDLVAQTEEPTIPVFTTKPHGYWTEEKGNKMRSFFERFALENQFDPLVAENWYLYGANSFASYPDANYVLSNFKGSFVAALVTLFPELSLDESKFLTLKKNFYHNDENRRRVLEELADKLGFDPLIPENWYSTSSDSIKSNSRASSILSTYYGGSVVKCLQHLFPELALDTRKFPFLHQNYWNEERNRRHFFEVLAQKKGMDPLEPEDWYSLDPKEIIKFKSAKVVLSFYDGNYVKALLHLFPELDLEKDRFKFTILPENFWVESDHRKKLFLDFAKSRSFDPLVPDNWYPISASEFIESKDAETVLLFHGGSLPKALVHAFPDIGLDKTKFARNTENWANPKIRRMYFEDLAKENSFDPLNPENWYSIDPALVLNSKAVRSILAYHNRKWEQAIVDLFPEMAIDLSLFNSGVTDYWADAENRKSLFLDFAARSGFDPLAASNWYAVSEEKILAFKDVIYMLYYHKGSVARALTDLFPAISLDYSKFRSEYSSTWIYAKNRRSFLTTFAKENQFDPLSPHNWYPITNDLVLPYEGSREVLAFYKGNVQKAILSLFPEIGLEPRHFSLLPSGYWLDTKNQRNVFEKLAGKKGFDPKVSTNWYSVTSQEVQKIKGGNAVLCIHKGNLVQSLLAVFPDIGLVEELFAPKNNAHALNANARKKFFQFAKENNFDPLLPSNWYSVDSRRLFHFKGMQSTLVEFNGDMTKALMVAFPEIGFKKSVLAQALQTIEKNPRNPWLYEQNRKKLFLDFAAENNFDPYTLSNWDSANWDNFLAKKGAGAVLFYYRGSTKKALQALFAS
eukprot:Phypoly_transcript_01093.p1 GENE.Phypoly_transcript_01093~~Phypoly_transcript_01093.p1  ORF type:complete len:1197 (+),score=192.21 Phypoly_transcript_01093:78-3668(+)